MRTIAVANQKGGCGKTTTVVNLAAAFAELGKKILVVDLDSQGHATLGFGHEPDELDRSLYDVLVGEQVGMDAVIISTPTEGVDIVPGNILLSGAELELAALHHREYILKRRLSCVGEIYDICIIDCSPSLGLLTLNALVAGSDVIIPVQTQYYALEGLKQLLGTIDVVRQRFNHGLNILGILLTFVEQRTLLCRQIQDQMREYFGKVIFDGVIHRTVRLAESSSAGESVLMYDPKCKASAEYRMLAMEINRAGHTCQLPLLTSTSPGRNGVLPRTPMREI